MNCTIYKSKRKLEMYLYLAEGHKLEDVPEILMNSFGPSEFVMDLELSPERTLARADVKVVMSHLKDNGFYLQMPPEDPLLGLRINEAAKPE